MTAMRNIRLAAPLLLTAACSDANESDGAPVAQFGLVCAALRCDFTDESSDDVGITSWSWSFGDGAVSTEQNPFHVYSTAGSHEVRLTVQDGDGATDEATRTVETVLPVVVGLSCADGSAPGGFTSCSLALDGEAGVRVTLVSTHCGAHGNVFRLTAPVVDTLTTDGCYERPGKQITVPGPFPAGTVVSAEVTAPRLANPPQLRVAGAYPEWTLTYEDGQDADFDDMSITVTALPTGS
jgi:PKD repeat protein